MKPSLTVLFLLFTTLAFTQLVDIYEEDIYPNFGIFNNSLLENRSLYVSGKAHDQEISEQSCIRKLDLFGNVIWSTTRFDDDFDYTQVKRMHLSTDGFLYAYCQGSNYNGQVPGRIWKVDTLSGEIIYKVDITDHLNNDFQSIVDHGDDLLLFKTFRESEIIYFDKVEGAVVFTQEIPASRCFTLDTTQNRLFYTSGDTLIQTSPDDFSDFTWKTIIPTSSSADFYCSELVYEAATNSIFVFGSRSSGFGGYTYQVDATSGEMIWSSFTGIQNANSQVLDIAYSGYEIYGDHIYVIWRHRFVGGGYNQAAINAIDKNTGESIWLYSDYFGGQEHEEQAYLDLAVDQTGIYITGYYDGEGAGKWGVLKFDFDGNLLYETPLTPENTNDNKGIGIYALEDRIICLGNRGTNPEITEHYVELDKNTGAILSRKDIGGLAKMASSTKDLLQLPNGWFVSLMQKGKYGQFAVRDLNANVIWDSIYLDLPILGNPDNGHIAEDMAIINDSLVVTMGKDYFLTESYGIKRLLHIWNLNTQKMEFLIRTSEAADNAFDPIIEMDEERGFFCTLDPENGKTWVYQLGTVGTIWQITDEFNPSGWASENHYGRNANNQILLNLDSDHLLLISRYNWKIIDKSTLEFENISSGESINLCHVDFINPNQILFTAVANGTGNLQIIRLNTNDLNNPTVFEIPGHQAPGVKWIKGGDNSTVYILSDNDTEVFVTKMNITNGSVDWTTSVSNANLEFPLIYATDIDYNATGDYVAVSGYRSDLEQTESQPFFGIISGNGDKIADVTRDGDHPGENKSFVVASDNTSEITYIGGQMNKDTTFTSAFLFRVNGEDLFYTLKGKVFFDRNENDTLDTDEPFVQIGRVTIDNEYDTYLNANGLFETYVGPGEHSATYQVPDNWMLTTDSLTFNLHTDSSDFATDTLCFGIKPTVELDSIHPFIVSEAFICDRPFESYLHLKNTGTTIQNVILRLDYTGEYLSANQPPDSINSSSLFWYYQDVVPGTSELIQVAFTAPGVSNIGDTLNLSATALLYDTLTGLAFDSLAYTYKDIVLCAYDPNDKMANPSGQGEYGLTLFGRPIDYTIRFQNTGNYPAQNIRITDDLDNDLDWSTFEFIGSSHPITAINRSADQLEFIFQNIYLPDSTNNEPESHGYLSYRIQPKAVLAEFTTIRNEAYIYFDANPPIITNRTLNTLVSDLSATVSTSEIISNFKVFPNPVSDLFHLCASRPDFQHKDWQLIDVTGRLHLSGRLNEECNDIEVRTLPNGLYFLRIGEKTISKVLVLH